MDFKQKVYHQYLKLLTEKISLLKNTLRDLTASAANETKSTAGDKHETALAMLQIEQENVSTQLKDALNKKEIFERINATAYTPKISMGNLIKTSKGYLFMSVAIGKIVVDNTTIIALSPQSPLGKKLLGLKVNDTAEINGITYTIEEIA